MAYTFTDDFLAQLRNRCDIEDIIGRYVQLKKTGSSTVGLCPFHSERTPSLSRAENRCFIVSAVTRAATLSLSSWKRSICRMWMPWYFLPIWSGFPFRRKTCLTRRERNCASACLKSTARRQDSILTRCSPQKEARGLNISSAGSFRRQP